MKEELTENRFIPRLKEISDKNKDKEYSLGDVLLLDKFEKDLLKEGYTKDEIISFSPSFYRAKKT